jgi:hypothetical protein
VPDHAPLGAADCEARREGAVAQPVNAVTSTSYLAAGAHVWWRSRRLPPRKRWRALAFGGALVGVGAGSVAYHGPGGDLSRIAHDATITGLLAVLPVDELARQFGWEPRRAASVWAATVIPAWSAIAALPEASGAVHGLLGGALAASELDRRRTEGLRVSPPRRRAARRAEAVATAALATGVLAYLGGRTSSRFCAPRSLVQLHGVWHVLGAVAAAAWGERALVEPELR